ncbi:hypothetical protein ACQP2Y_46690 (plasmid) [Actinoplanes sp. CA-051413]|uniref:hypothetical protein n=1 Tax=Actinoplanes sp. CA-051413 TaxID=3239899 RepID=UPI003D99B09E
MPHADTLTVIHDDDTRTTYTDARYQLHRGGVRIWTADGETVHTDVLMTQAYRQRTDGEATR